MKKMHFHENRNIFKLTKSKMQDKVLNIFVNFRRMEVGSS